MQKPQDSVEISGFSGFVVGLAFLPYTGYALLTAFNVVRCPPVNDWLLIFLEHDWIIVIYSGIMMDDFC